MSAATARKAHTENTPFSTESLEHLFSTPQAEADFGSPVHAMQAKLERAVFESFSAKEQVASHPSGARTVALVTLAALAGWGLILGGVVLKVL